MTPETLFYLMRIWNEAIYDKLANPDPTKSWMDFALKHNNGMYSREQLEEVSQLFNWDTICELPETIL